MLRLCVIDYVHTVYNLPGKGLTTLISHVCSDMQLYL